jgi:predicted glycosyltransferase
LPVLTYLKKRGTRIFASIGYPYIVQENIKILTFYTNFYDKFLIHTPRNLEYQYLYKNISHPELRKIYDKVFRLLEKKIIYTGYILPAAARDDKGISGYDIKGRLKIMGRPLVIVSRGGGVIYPRIIINSILVNKYLPKEVFFIIVAGPSSSKQELKLFNKLIKEAKAKNIKLYKYTPDFSALLKASDISISMAGYNTAVQLLYFKKESILIPSSVDPEIATGYCSEQLSRAELLHRYLHSVVLDYGKMSVKDMAKAIRERLLRRRPISAKIDDNWFYGDKVTADYLINNG